MNMKDKYKALRIAVNRYIEQNLLDIPYYVDARYKGKIHILDKEKTIIAEAIILPLEIAIIPMGIYNGKYPNKIFKIGDLIHAL